MASAWLGREFDRVRTDCEETAKIIVTEPEVGDTVPVCAVSDPAGPLVLVVEDEPEIASLMRDFLEADGFRVRGIKLQVTAHTGHEVRIDRDGFERALANIIDNALRHTPQGGTVQITCGEDTDNTFVHVVDDGPGIPPDLLPSLFEPTVRAESTRSTYPDGAGLGLTIAAHLLRTQGGTIDAANAHPRGAILTLRLPRNVA